MARPGSSPREQFLSTCLASSQDRLTATFSPVVSAGFVLLVPTLLLSFCPQWKRFHPVAHRLLRFGREASYLVSLLSDELPLLCRSL